MQTAPSTDVIGKLLGMQDQAAITLSPDVQLLDILDHHVDPTGLGAPSAAGVEKPPTVYSHVNRVIDRIAAAAGATVALTSHSFRRDGTQHANDSDELTARWISNSGAWNMSTMNKGFNSIFNTS
ncbi:RxLR effector candidate protein [Phytophthora palmivora]|uniref:RxLR effector candidate protein n=1 Tax=Phytophthora palmivora TaxID=4796 RepID=A0A2P4XA56_9STRA|nr:RxLR effector candidate protein [Phytophthora palmivora]